MQLKIYCDNDAKVISELFHSQHEKRISISLKNGFMQVFIIEDNGDKRHISTINKNGDVYFKINQVG